MFKKAKLKRKKRKNLDFYSKINKKIKRDG